MNDLFSCVIITVVSAVIGFTGCRLIVAAKRNRSLKKDCQRLAEVAKETLVRSGTPVSDQAWENTYIVRALADRDKDLLLAYANLMGSHGGLHISFAVLMVKMVKLNNPSTALSVESLTAQQVTAFHAIRNEYDLEDENWNFLESSASKAGAYAMEHLEDYPLVLLIVKRGIRDLDEIKTVLAEMKATKTVSLSDGML